MLDTIAVFLRFFTKRRSSRGLGLDDWLIAVALVWPVTLEDQKVNSNMCDNGVKLFSVAYGALLIVGEQCSLNDAFHCFN